MLLTRRSVAGTLLMGWPMAGTLEAAADGQQRQAQAPDSDTLREMADALKRIGAELRAQGDPPILGPIREAQRTFLRLNQKFPDYIEVGVAVWEQLHDWQVHTQQMLNVTRLTDGRYVMQTMLCTFVLRTDLTPAYIGPASDSLYG